MMYLEKGLLIHLKKCIFSMIYKSKLPLCVSFNSSKGVIKWRDLLGTPVEEIAEELSESGVMDVRQIGSKETGIYVLSPRGDPGWELLMELPGNE